MLLIDAFNVLHLPGALQDGRAMGPADLARLLGQSRYAGRRAVVVCDGVGPRGAGSGTGDRPGSRSGSRGVEIVFSGGDRTADDEIEARLGRAGGHGIVVVSDDRPLRRAAGRAGARSLASGDFLAHLLGDAAKPKTPPPPRFARDIPLDRYSVAHWMRAFGLSANGLLDRRAGRAEAGGSPPGRGSRPGGPGRPDLLGARAPEPEAAPVVQPGRGEPSEPAMPDERVLRMESLADDPVIREALEAWRGGLTLDDLDMARGLGEHPPGGGGPDGQR